MRTFVYCVLVLLGLYSCENRVEKAEKQSRHIFTYTDSPSKTRKEIDLFESSEYLDWFKKYSAYLAEEVTIDSMVFGVLVQPVDFLVLKGMNNVNDHAAYEKERKEYEGMEYYLFTFGSTDGSNVLDEKRFPSIDKRKLVEFFNFTIQENFSLDDCYGERSCAFYHLEPTSTLRPYHTAVVAFERRADIDTCDKTIIYKDKAFNKGIVKITIPAEKLKLIPIINRKNNENL